MSELWQQRRLLEDEIQRLDSEIAELESTFELVKARRESLQAAVDVLSNPLREAESAELVLDFSPVRGDDAGTCLRCMTHLTGYNHRDWKLCPACGATFDTVRRETSHNEVRSIEAGRHLASILNQGEEG